VHGVEWVICRWLGGSGSGSLLYVCMVVGKPEYRLFCDLARTGGRSNERVERRGNGSPNQLAAGVSGRAETSVWCGTSA